jgi:hypothetical protein
MWPDLDDQMCSYTVDTKESPDALDACVWAATELKQGTSAMVWLSAISKVCTRCDGLNRRSSTVCKSCGAELDNAA